MVGKIDYLEEANDMYASESSLLERMDYDADMVNMVRATEKLLDADDKEIPHSVYVVLNDLASFTWRVETALNSAVEQVKVESSHKGFDTSYIEQFIKAGFSEADTLLALKDMYPFDAFIDQQTFRRGRVSSRCDFHIKDGKLVAGIIPSDTRYVAYDSDNDGLRWMSIRYFRSASKVLADYPEAKGKTAKNLDTELLYIIARDVTQMWVAGGTTSRGVLLREIPNRLGYVPAIYRKVPMGSMLLDKDSEEYQGESGLFLVRDVFPEIVRLISMVQSINLKAVDQALQLKIPREEMRPNAEQGKTVDEVTAPGVINEVPVEGGYMLMPLGQLVSYQLEKVHNILEDRMQRGMSSYYQNVLQPKTATEIMKISQEQGDIITPRIATRGLLKRDISRMFIKQTIEACEKAKVRVVVLDGQEFEVSKLKGDYSIDFKYHFKDPRLDAARQSLAVGQRGLLPDRDIRINTLQREDWEGDERQLRWEEDERLSPLVKLDRNIRALLEDAKRGEPGAERQAKMLVIQMVPALRQAMQGLMTPNMLEELKPSQAMIPLLPEGNQGGQQNV